MARALAAPSRGTFAAARRGMASDAPPSSNVQRSIWLARLYGRNFDLAEVRHTCKRLVAGKAK